MKSRSRKKLILIDNYDSFSYNLYQMLGALGAKLTVIRNDEKAPEEIEAMKPAGCCVEVVQKLGKRTPILGVCLGHQAICTAFGGTVTYADRMMHGKTSVIRVNTDTPLFRGSKEEMTVGRYHSLAAREETLPDCLEITARTAGGEIMAVQHREYPVYGVQFHPESILTPDGIHLFSNFLEVMNHDQ